METAKRSYRAAINGIGKSVPAIKDAANKVWVLVIVGVLWSSSYVIFVCSKTGVPQDLKHLLAGALFVLGLMFLFVNLRPVKIAGIVE